MSEMTVPARRSRPGLPRPIRKLLGRLGLRLRLASMVRGLGTTGIVLAIVAALGMAADFAWDLPQVARWAIWAVWLAIGGLVLSLTAFCPVLRRLGAFDLAAAAEEGHPELGESLTGAVAMLGTGAPHGSPELIAAVADQAARSCQTLRPAGTLGWGPAFRRAVLGVLAVGLVIIPPLLRPDSFGVLARRFLMPWADIDRLPRIVITVTPGDQTIAAGSDVTFTAEIRPLFALGPAPALDPVQLVTCTTVSCRVQWLDMSAVTDSASTEKAGSSTRRFSLTLPRLNGTIEYQVSSSKVSSPRYRITVLEPLSVAPISAPVEPPAHYQSEGGR
jgi:hypothetical protein